MMVTNIDAISAIGKGVQAYSKAEAGNPNKESSGHGFNSDEVKHWVVLPLIFFHGAGFIALVFLATIFLDPTRNASDYQWAWPALIVALAGLPFAFATNARTLVNALTIGN